MLHFLHIHTFILIFILPLGYTFESCPPCRCAVDNQYRGIYVICSNRRLTTVPDRLPRGGTSLLLNRNNITSLPNLTFSRMKNLRHLDLSRNNIVWLPYCVFIGLDKLESLNLDYNKIAPCGEYFEPIFLLPLKNLLRLSVYKQRTTCPVIILKRQRYKYFGNAFPRSLQELSLDCYNCDFTSDFLSLRNLSLLSFSTQFDQGNCVIYRITEFSFLHVTQLKTLNLSDCEIFSLAPKAFLPLKQLKSLDLSVYVIDGCSFDAFVNATMYLRDSQIEILKFRNLNCVEVKENVFRFLTSTSLKELYINSALYALIREGTFKFLPRTLEILSFQHFQYPHSKVFNDLHEYISLWKMDLSGMILPDDSACADRIIPPHVTTFICNNCQCPEILGGHTGNNTLIPYIKNKKTLPKLIANRNRIEYITCIVLWIDCDGIEYLDLRDNSVYGVDDGSFSGNNSVSYLNLAKNRLANIPEEKFLSLFKILSKLQFIDMSENGISSLPMDIFTFSHTIRVINISNNNLMTVVVKLKHLTHLKTLDVSNNKLHELDLRTRTDLEYLPGATVRLYGNALVCGCEEMTFLRWAKTNPRKVQVLASLSCRLSNGQYGTFDNLDGIIRDLEELCKSHVVEISVSVSVAVSALAAVIGVLGYRNRWKMRYLYHVGRRGYRRHHGENIDEHNAYKYDAFVSYADEDRRFVIDAMIPELEQKCGLKLCIHHRDFLPGEVIATNIVNAIQNSRKTLIILSPSFMKSTWCEFEYNMARMEGVTRRQEIVLVVLYEYVPVNLLPKDMAMMLRRNCYIEYNNDIFDNEVFWYNVLESIRIDRPVD